MGIERFDKNFKQSGRIEGDVVFYDATKAPFELYGLYYESDKGFMRVTEDVSAQCNDGVKHLAEHSAGGRIKFSTNSAKIGIKVFYKIFYDFGHMPRSGSCGFTLVDETDGKNFIMGISYPAFSKDNSVDKHAWNRDMDCQISLDASWGTRGGTRQYCLYMPSYAGVKSVEIALDVGAEVFGGRKYEDGKSVLYYGSSITQGGCASRPDNTYQAHISKWTNTDYVNLGFSGSARGEKAMAEYLASFDCNVFVCDYDHNSPSAKELSERHYPFYKAYRELKKDTPILFVSHPNYDTMGERDERIKVIKETVKKAKAEGDKNVYFLNGKYMCGRNYEERTACFVDGCHPTDLGFYRMAKSIRKALAKIDKAYEKKK